MSIGLTEFKRESALQIWSARVAECRNSGKAVKTWCHEQGIAMSTYYSWEKRLIDKAFKERTVPSAAQNVQLMQIVPEILPNEPGNRKSASIHIRHGESEIRLPAGMNMDDVADLVKALNRHA